MVLLRLKYNISDDLTVANKYKNPFESNREECDEDSEDGESDVPVERLVHSLSQEIVFRW